MHGAEGINLKLKKYKYLRALALSVLSLFTAPAYSDFVVFTTSDRISVEGASGYYFGSQLSDSLNLPSSESSIIYDPYPEDFEDVLSDLAKSRSGKSSHVIYIALPGTFSRNELNFFSDGEYVYLRDIISTIGRLEGDYLLIIETEENFPSQPLWPDIPNNVTFLALESTERIQRTNDLSEDPPRGSDFSILFFQELSVSGEEPGPDLPVNTLLTNLFREFAKNNMSYFVLGMGSNTELPRFIPETGSYYFANLDAKAEDEARKEKEAQLAREEAEARKEREAQLAREQAEAAKEREAQLARETAELLKEQDQLGDKLMEMLKGNDEKALEEKESQKTAKAEKEESNAVDSSDEPDLGEALALIEQMKAEAAEREKQLKEATEQAEKKRKNTTSFGF